MRVAGRVALICVAMAVAGPAASAAGQVAGLLNARLMVTPAGPSLDADVAAILAADPAPRWIGYEVPGRPGRGGACCHRDLDQGCCAACWLEGSPRGQRSGITAPADVGATGVVNLEDTDVVRVLMRAQDGEIGRVAVYSQACQIDAGHLPVTWLTGVDPVASVTVLADIAEREAPPGSPGDRGSVREGALTALALHDVAEAGARLAAWARDADGGLQRQSIFWLGAARGREGFEVLGGLAASHPDPRVREQTTFALQVSGQADAIDLLIGMARQDSSPRVRSQALFWLSQQAGERAVAAIDGAVELDPDEEVRVQALFALSQLPPDRGIPLLIRVARTHDNPRVRKQAIFWLGQSDDPRALALIEELLKG